MRWTGWWVACAAKRVHVLQATSNCFLRTCFSGMEGHVSLVLTDLVPSFEHCHRIGQQDSSLEVTPWGCYPVVLETPFIVYFFWKVESASNGRWITDLPHFLKKHTTLFYNWENRSQWKAGNTEGGRNVGKSRIIKCFDDPPPAPDLFRNQCVL